MHPEPTIVTHVAPLPNAADLAHQREVDRGIAAAASAEASKRELAYMEALGRPRTQAMPLPEIKTASLPADYQERLGALDEEIHARGVAIDREKLTALGKQRFTRLLELDHECREEQRTVGTKTDLGDWPSVARGLYGANAFTVSSVPPATMSETVAGNLDARERERVRQVNGWDDLFKAASSEPRIVKFLYAFHDQYASLVFGQSLLEGVSFNGQLRSRFFCGGTGPRLSYFRDDWLGCLAGPHWILRLQAEALDWCLVAWFSDETTAAPDPVAIGRDWFGKRSLSETQLGIVRGVTGAFLRGYSSWSLWEQASRSSRTCLEVARVNHWYRDLASRFKRIAQFYNSIADSFWHEVDSHDVRFRHREPDPVKYRAFVDRSLGEALEVVSGIVTALTAEQVPQSIVARFPGTASVLFEGPLPTSTVADKLRDLISAKLAGVFPGATFPIQIEEVTSK